MKIISTNKAVQLPRRIKHNCIFAHVHVAIKLLPIEKSTIFHTFFFVSQPKIDHFNALSYFLCKVNTY